MLRKNSYGPLVVVLTKQLKALGYYSEPVTNTFDAEVVKAVKAFQVQSTDSSGRPLVVDGSRLERHPGTQERLAARCADARR